MKTPAFLCLTALWAAAVASASPIDAVIVAAMKPAEAPNYSWTATVVRDSRSYAVEGKTLVGSYTEVTVPADLAMPINPAARGRAGRGSSDSDTVALFKGDEKYIVETSEGWMTPAEFAAWSNFSGGASPQRMAPGRRRGGRGGISGGLPLSFTISQPHEDIGIIIGSYASMAVDGEVASGRLTDTGAELLLLPPGQENVTPERATGSFKLWIANGVLTKYEVQVEGVVSITAGKERREVKTTQVVTTELRNLGSTKLDVSAEAKKKLE